MTKTKINNTQESTCSSCAHFQAEKTFTTSYVDTDGKVIKSVKQETFSLATLNAYVCTNSDSDHFGHITMNYHPVCEKGLIQ